MLEDGHDIRTVQELPGHADVSTTMVDTQVVERGVLGVTSPGGHALSHAALSGGVCRITRGFFEHLA